MSIARHVPQKPLIGHSIDKSFNQKLQQGVHGVWLVSKPATAGDLERQTPEALKIKGFSIHLEININYFK